MSTTARADHSIAAESAAPTATVAASGFAPAVQPLHASTLIATDTAGLSTGDVRIAAPAGGELPLHFARPQGSARVPVVLVVQEIFGVHEHIRDVCRRLAKIGYLAIAPELYFRHGDPRTYDDIPAILQHIVPKVSDAEVISDLDACAAWASAQGGDVDRLAITGFCWGGRITWLYAAHKAGLKAAVAWYGRLRGPATANTPRHPIELVDALHAPVLALYGGDDPGIPLTDVDAMRATLQASTNANARQRVRRLPGSPARLSRRLPSVLPQGGRGRRLETHGGLVRRARVSKPAAHGDRRPPQAVIRGASCALPLSSSLSRWAAIRPFANPNTTAARANTGTR